MARVETKIDAIKRVLKVAGDDRDINMMNAILELMKMMKNCKEYKPFNEFYLCDYYMGIDVQGIVLGSSY